MANNSRGGQKELVSELPLHVEKDLHKLLNQHKKWEILAGLMGYDTETIDDLKREKNPTEQLLIKWGQSNPRIVKLFVLLSDVPHPESMSLLKPFVDQKYHRLIAESSRKIHPSEQRNPNIKDLKIAMQNFNNVQPAQTNDKKVMANNEQPEAAKILNNSPQPSSVLVPNNSNKILVAPPSTSSPNILPAMRAAAGTTEINNEFKFLSGTALPQIPYEELRRATGGWNSARILGKGGFGTVFYGKWKHMEVAIKRIEQRGPRSVESYLIQLEQSLKELKILNSFRHDNILSLYAYSMGSEAPCLVYQFMTNGSLEGKLLCKKNHKPLNWVQRHNIAKGTARGLQFLHTVGDKPLIHGNIKSANILLDNDFDPRITDFGLAREGPGQDSMKVSRIYGTRSYLPDEFLESKTLSTKIDTYSYGIVLLELATGLPAYDGGRPGIKYLKDFIDSRETNLLHFLKDERAGTENDQVFGNLIILGKWCSNKLATERPEMEFVLSKIDEL